MKQKKGVELTRAELGIMRILWQLKTASVNDMLDSMSTPKPAYNTVSTIVRILERKGVVAHEALGKSHRYHPLIGREEYTQTFMHSVIGNFFDNSVTQMFSFLARQENFSPREIEKITRIAEKAIESKK